MKKEEGTGEARLFVQVPAAAKGELNQKGRHASETKAWGSGKPQNLSRERRGTVCLSILKRKRRAGLVSRMERKK